MPRDHPGSGVVAPWLLPGQCVCVWMGAGPHPLFAAALLVIRLSLHASACSTRANLTLCTFCSRKLLPIVSLPGPGRTL